MKDFFELREEAQQLNESGMTDALNDLQDFWSANADEFMNQSAGPLFPMFGRPFDRIIKGGVMIVGINPGAKEQAVEMRKKMYDVFSGQQPPVWNAKRRRWRQVDVGRSLPKGTPGARGEKELRFSQLSMDFEKRGGHPNSNYIKGWRKLFAALGRSDLESKIMMTNLIPFSSKGTSSFPSGTKRKKLMSMSQKWLQEYIKVSKPSVVIIAGTDGWKAIQPMLTSTEPSSEIAALAKSGLETKSNGGKVGSILKVGHMTDGTPVLNFMHPSSQSGQPTGPTYKDPEKLKQVRNIFNKYVK